MQEVDLPAIDRAVQELRERWARGERAMAEGFFARDPELLQDRSAGIDLIYEEICVREAAGEGRVWEEAFERFPDWRAELQALRDCHRLLEPTEPAPRYPDVVVSVGLSDIVAKCLEADPGRRYPDAAALAADLRRHLSHQPLRGVANRSLVERWRKWRRRHPVALRQALAAALLLLLGLGLLAGGAFYVNDRAADARQALDEGRKLLQQDRAYEPARKVLQDGLARVEHLPFEGGLTEQLRHQLRRAEQAQDEEKRQALIHDFHKHIERIRLVADLEPIPPADLRALDRSARDLWDRRAEIRQRLGETARAEVDADLRELAVALTDLSVRLASGSEQTAARQQALQVLDEAEKLCGADPILDQERRLYDRPPGTEPAGLAVSLPAGNPANSRDRDDSELAWQHLVQGRSWLRAGQLERAARELKRACELQPRDAWCNYYRGLCAYRLKHYDEAARAFSVCVGAAPDRAGCFYSRALALTALGRNDEALDDYDHAVQRDPKMAVARLNRGMLQYQEKHYGQALTDLEQALADGADSALANYNLALVHLARQETTAALSCVERALEQNPHQQEAARLRERLVREASRP
jgi:tetratricopeptide (TPR) repeat protein